MIPSQREKLQSILFFVSDNIYTDIDEKSDPVYISICDQSAIKLLKSTAKILGLFYTSLFTYTIFPAFITIENHEMQLILPVLVPFTDLNSINGLTINVLNQLITIFTGTVGNFGTEVIICMFKNTIWAMAVTICYSIDKLITSFDESEPFSNRIVTFHFQNVILQVQDINRYVFEIWKA